MKIKILLTYDHELPLGKLRTSFDKALFSPTEKILALSAKKNVPVTLFTDILCAEQYRKWDNVNFYQPYVNQLQATIAAGSDVQLHLHPHWLTSNNSNGIVTPSADYSLAHFANHPIHDIESIIKNASLQLNEICTPALQNYRVVAYRAGGFNIEPASNKIFSSLIKNGILYDSSIPFFFYFASSLSLVDFRKLPDLPNWYIDTSGNFRVAGLEGLLEIPVAAIPKTPFEIPTRFKLKKYQSRAPENHGSMLHEGKPAGLIQRMHMLFSSRILTFDNHTLSPAYLMRILDYNVNRFKNHEIITLATCSHPKTMGNYSFYLMESFIDMARAKYPDIEFTTFSLLTK
jgi:hypothetical protein